MSAPVPRATYRLQLRRDFGFDAAAALAPYLARLGISHAYLSPILKARAGSTHGYDTIDHTEINPELGGIEGFRAMAATLRRHGIGILADFVPNHMGIGGSDNPLWLEVLEWGEASRYAAWFDITWHPRQTCLDGKVLVPFLDKTYEQALAAGDLVLRYDATAGEFAIWANAHHKLPLAPATYRAVLGDGAIWGDLPAQFATVGALDAHELKARLAARTADASHAATLARRIAETNAPGGRPQLDELVGRQHWRLAPATVANTDINYRRFFAINGLAGLRIEREDVFEHAHRLMFALIGEGLIDGLRIDHIDGLWDPGSYCRKVRQGSPRPLYLVVEKILARDEWLPGDWGVDGTTGYEFSALVTPLLADPDGEEGMSAAYRELAGAVTDPAGTERRAKLEVMRAELAAEMHALAAGLEDLARTDPAAVQFQRAELETALCEIIASLPVYRTYADADGMTPEDRRLIGAAVADAARRRPDLRGGILDFLRDVLTGAWGPQALNFARRVQQFTGPVVAKGLEDTALYRYNRLIALNDVGERPAPFSAGLSEFHRANIERRARFPDTMLASSSHDAKRGEDARTRIVALSGHADPWRAMVEACLGLLERQGAPAIDPADSYLFLQMLVGSWPIDPEEARPEALIPRFSAAMQKALREAGVRSTWSAPNEPYERAVDGFIRLALETGTSNAFLSAFRAFIEAIGEDAAACSLVATTLKLTLPGVPDIYQGAELWEQSMVDPDNRRPVDFRRHADLLDIAARQDLSALRLRWRDGRLKLGLIHRLLAARRRLPDLFARGTYEPLEFRGGDGRVGGFLRRHNRQALMVMFRLYPWRGEGQAEHRPLLPSELETLEWEDALDGSSAPTATVESARFRTGLPVCVLLSAGG